MTNFQKKDNINIGVVLVCSFIILSCNASNAGYMGDLNNDLYFNSIDLSLFRKELQNAEPIQYSTILDFNVDGKIDLRDLIRMKKYLVGDFLHSYTIEEGFSWILLDGEGEFALVTGIGYMFSSSCYTKTVCAPGRCVWEASAFIRTDKYINPEYPQPTFNISNTTINDETVSMSAYNNVIVDPNWIWKCYFSEDIFYVPTLSEFNSRFTIMLDKSPYPYREMNINFNF